MDDRVIEAAAKAMKDWNYEPEGDRYVPNYWDELAGIAIRAADAARAEDVKAAVSDFEAAVRRHEAGVRSCSGWAAHKAALDEVMRQYERICSLLNLED